MMSLGDGGDASLVEELSEFCILYYRRLMADAK